MRDTYMKSGIYLIKNIVNNKVYIGSAVNIDNRWPRHRYDLKEGKHHSEHLQSAWNKYGEQSFTFEVLEEVSNQEHLLAYEQVYLDYYKSYEIDRGYNICKVAGSSLGIKHSEETRKKMSESKNKPEAIEHMRKIKTGKKASEETRKKIKEARNKPEAIEHIRKIISGKKHSEETRKKIGEANKRRIVSEETRRKIGEASKGRWLGRKRSEEAKKKMREAKKVK